MIAGLLFLAVVYFAVGQAAATRNSAQTAADAAALAAAQDARDQLREGWLDVILEPEQWPRFLEGKDYLVSSACQEAAYFASKNAAEVKDGDCVRLPSGREGFSVTVSTTGSVGRSVVPGIDSQHATASAKAEIVPRCTFVPPPTSGETTLEPAPPESGEEPPPDRGPISGLTCDGDDWTIDPDDPTLPSAAELFTVRLTSDDE